MKKRTFMILMTVALMATWGLISCEKEEDKTLKVSFSKTEFSINETSTSTLEVPVKLNGVADRNLEIGFEIQGTAEADVHYETIENQTVIIEEGEDSTVILIDPINETKIEGDKTLELTLQAGDGYILNETHATTVTILDNGSAPSDAPVVKFTSENTLTNAYLQDTVEMSIGLSEALENDVMIPVKFDGSTAQEGTHYELVGLSENNEVEVPAGEVSATFGVAVQYTGELDIEKLVQVDFAEPVVTDYTVDDTDNSRQVEIIDPTVNNIWFLDGKSWNGGNQKIIPPTNAEGQMAYTSDCRPKDWILAEGVYEPYAMRKEADGEFGRAFPPQVVVQHEEDPNAWAGDWSFTYERVDDPCDETPYYPYFYTYMCSAYDLADDELMTADYLVGYGVQGVKIDKYLRFAAMNKEGTEGKVVIPKQTLTAYAAADGFDWEGESDAGGGWGMQDNDQIDSRETEGVISESQNVKEVKITVHGEGSFNLDSKLIEFTVYFSSEDPNLKADQAKFKIYPTRDDVPAR